MEIKQLIKDKIEIHPGKLFYKPNNQTYDDIRQIATRLNKDYVKDQIDYDILCSLIVSRVNSFWAAKASEKAKQLNLHNND